MLHGFNIVPMQHLGQMADIGIQLLLFSVGLKLKPSSLVRREVLMVGVSHLLVMAIISALVFFWLGEHITGGLVLGISLGFSSTVLALKVMEDNGELTSLHGRDVLSILILQDIVAVALLALSEGKQPTPWTLALFLIPLLQPVAHWLLGFTRASELKLLLGVFLALAGGILAEHLGVSAEIGALLTGILLAAHPKTEEISTKLWSLKELFLVAFFLEIGISDLPNQEQVYESLLLLALLPIQGLIFFGLFLLAGMRARTAFVSSMALMTYSEFALITTGSIVDAQLLPPEWKAIISLAVAGSLAIGAPLNKFADRLFLAMEPLLIRFEKKSSHPDRLPESFGSAEWLVIGMGRTGVASYQALIEKGERVVGLDADPTVLKSLRSTGRRVVYADVGDSELWPSLPLDKVKGIILTLPSFDNRLNAIKQLRKSGFIGLIGTICYLIEDENQLKKQGASFVIHPLDEAGNQLAKQMLLKAVPTTLVASLDSTGLDD